MLAIVLRVGISVAALVSLSFVNAPPLAAQTHARETTDPSSRPTEVLVGTEVEKLDSYLADRAPIRIPGTYLAEQGGALASVRIERVAGKVNVLRTFREPGASTLRAEYRNCVLDDAYQRVSGPTLDVIGVKGGIIVFESKSRVDGIPDSLWILYRLRESRERVKR